MKIRHAVIAFAAAAPLVLSLAGAASGCAGCRLER